MTITMIICTNPVRRRIKSVSWISPNGVPFIGNERHEIDSHFMICIFYHLTMNVQIIKHLITSIEIYT